MREICSVICDPAFQARPLRILDPNRVWGELLADGTNAMDAPPGRPCSEG